MFLLSLRVGRPLGTYEQDVGVYTVQVTDLDTSILLDFCVYIYILMLSLIHI